MQPHNYGYSNQVDLDSDKNCQAEFSVNNDLHFSLFLRQCYCMSRDDMKYSVISLDCFYCFFLVFA